MPVIDVRINIAEIRKPELDAASSFADGIAQQLERRVMFSSRHETRRHDTMRIGALGIKVRVSGPPQGNAKIARTKVLPERGRVPLRIFRANVTTDWAKAKTTYGVIGVKVWIFKSEIFTPAGPGSPA